jgi:hypothetical protein
MKLGNNIAVAAILTNLNAARANDIITRRIALLRSLGEDVRNTVSWRDAVAEQGQFQRAVSMQTWHLRTERA